MIRSILHIWRICSSHEGGDCGDLGVVSGFSINMKEAMREVNQIYSTDEVFAEILKDWTGVT